MADTRVQLKVEDWIRREWMPDQFGQKFFRERLKLNCGGVFDFDAVSADETIAANISTSGAKTAGGKHAVGKMLKVRSDVYFLLLANVQRKLIILTEYDMYARWLKEKEAGRVPHEIEFFHAEIPTRLREALDESRLRASKEVRPK